MSREIQKLAVVGAGAMGSGIAQVAAAAGYETLLFDIDAAARQRALEAIRKNLDKGVRLGKVSPETSERARQHLQLCSRLEEAVGNADLVIEAVPESMSLKIETFQDVVRAAPEYTLLATNTSALSITEMAAATDRPQRFAGMHFFNPVHIMRLVELVQGLETSTDTMSLLRVVAENMGKDVVEIRESPGFVTSRINALIGNEAFHMLQEGVASAADIDKALKLGLNHPMGPFEMIDLVGLDVRLSVLRYLQQTLGELYRPNRLLVQYVQAGRLGRKVGQGVYNYDENGQRIEEGNEAGQED
jgi:3-hydroxybutyryl-CoA dehydrogenase